MKGTSDIEGIKKATGVGFRKHISDYDSKLIAIPLAYPAERRYAVYTTNELTSVCPLSGLPDFYECMIETVPDDMVVELKTMKFYLGAYRDVGILHEDLAVKLMVEIAECIDPLWIKVTLVSHVRGGIGTSVIAERGDKKTALDT